MFFSEANLSLWYWRHYCIFLEVWNFLYLTESFLCFSSHSFVTFPASCTPLPVSQWLWMCLDDIPHHFWRELPSKFCLRLSQQANSGRWIWKRLTLLSLQSSWAMFWQVSFRKLLAIGPNVSIGGKAECCQSEKDRKGKIRKNPIVASIPGDSLSVII